MVDPWQGPTPVSNQFPRNEPDGIRKLLAKIDAVALSVREVTSNLLGSAGIRLTKLGMFIDSSLTVGGSQTVNGPLAVHGTAAFDGNTTIGGTLAVTGTLSLPAGIINNDALANPVKSQTGFNSTSNFGLTTADVDLVVVVFTPPAGFTQATVIAASFFDILSAAGTTGTSVFTTLAVDGDLSTDSETAVHSTLVSMDTITKNHTQSALTVVGGVSFSVRLKARGSVVNPANIANLAWVKVSVFYTR